MDSLHSKFVVLQNQKTKEKLIYLGRCKLHKELVQRVLERNKLTDFHCLSGGYFEYNSEEKILTLNKESQDFGIYSFDDVVEILKNHNLYDEPYFSKSMIARLSINSVLVYNHSNKRYEIIK